MTWDAVAAGLPVVLILLVSLGCIVLAAWLYARRNGK